MPPGTLGYGRGWVYIIRLCSLLLTFAETVLGMPFSLLQHAASLGAVRRRGNPCLANQLGLDVSPGHQWVSAGHLIHYSHFTDEELCVEKGRQLAKVSTVHTGGNHLDNLVAVLFIPFSPFICF